ncbi:unnamed protein product [Effrenium voratum]|uniref:EF-hand domain-containing protein n=1 Tax=Effrenium voratum TaxID=2562239 RepID=A0AA36J0W1_9DINO|nr:unnamed protein product [Effrenium voratum]CAJ1418083.1 unnamed protein product [Effrenium voratum]
MGDWEELIAQEQQELLRLSVQQHEALRQACVGAFSRLRSGRKACERKAALETDVKRGPQVEVVQHEARIGAEGHSLAENCATVQPTVDGDPMLPKFSLPQLSDKGSPVTIAKSRSAETLQMLEALPMPRPSEMRQVGARELRVDLQLTETSEGTFRHVAKRLKPHMDYIAGVLVLMNSVIMAVELELEGRANGHALDLSPSTNWEAMKPAFRVLDVMFVYIFLAELLVRVVADCQRFHRSAYNWFDLMLVLVGFFDVYVIMPMSDSNSAARNITLLRLFRTLKSLRSLRMVRTLRLFRGLRVLVNACQTFLPSLAWSMLLLFVLMSMSALILGNLLQEFVTEDSGPLEDRQWVWTHYGTALRSLWTIYEITFAGNWPTRASPVIDKVNPWYVMFYATYVTLIVFAIIRVITAIFLKDTLDAAVNDAEHIMAESAKKKAQYVKRLEGIFQAIDEYGDGMITQERLQDMLANPKVRAYFQILDVDVHESAALFHLLDDGDGKVTLEEFIDGITRCKGPARAIDQVSMQSDLKSLDRKLTKLGRLLQDVFVASKGISHTWDLEAAKGKDLKVFRMNSGGAGAGGFNRIVSPF